MRNSPANRPADRRLECAELLAGAPAEVGAARAELVRTGGRRRGGEHDHLFGPRDRHFFDQPLERTRTIAQAMRFTAPGAFRRKTNQVRIGGDRNRERRRQGIEHVIAADAGEIERLGLPAALEHRPGKEPCPVALAEEREHHVAPAVHVVREQHQLAESRLSDVLGEKLDVLASELRAAPRRESGSTTPGMSDR
jgi:hypothetical protein